MGGSPYPLKPHPNPSPKERELEDKARIGAKIEVCKKVVLLYYC